jgi:UDP-N-acetyl-D-mannosaminuronic acid dehydrogenase
LRESDVDHIPLGVLREVIEEADVLIILVNHKEFYSLDQRSLQGKIVIDTRGVLEV